MRTRRGIAPHPDSQFQLFVLLGIDGSTYGADSTSCSPFQVVFNDISDRLAGSGCCSAGPCRVTVTI
jgi:hypothetical protein